MTPLARVLGKRQISPGFKQQSLGLIFFFLSFLVNSANVLAADKGDGSQTDVGSSQSLISEREILVDERREADALQWELEMDPSLIGKKGIITGKVTNFKGYYHDRAVTEARARALAQCAARGMKCRKIGEMPWVEARYGGTNNCYAEDEITHSGFVWPFIYSYNTTECEKLSWSYYDVRVKYWAFRPLNEREIETGGPVDADEDYEVLETFSGSSPAAVATSDGLGKNQYPLCEISSNLSFSRVSKPEVFTPPKLISMFLTQGAHEVKICRRRRDGLGVVLAIFPDGSVDGFAF